MDVNTNDYSYLQRISNSESINGLVDGISFLDAVVQPGR
jgi:hypothetical protein